MTERKPSTFLQSYVFVMYIFSAAFFARIVATIRHNVYVHSTAFTIYTCEKLMVRARLIRDK